MRRMIRAVVFDVGECLVDETRLYGRWADWLGVPRHTFAAQFGADIAVGRGPLDTFEVFRPGFDLAEERRKRVAAGEPEWFGEHDLYPDVRLTIKELRRGGIWLGLADNLPRSAAGLLRPLFTGYVELMGLSEDWGVAKPDRAFFEHLVSLAPVGAEEILYVGDRLDHDIRPAAAGTGAGLRTALIRRGPWGFIQQHDPEADTLPTLRIDSLRQLATEIPKFNAAARAAH